MATGCTTTPPGANRTLTWAHLVALGVNDGPYAGPVRVRMGDGSLTATAAGSLAVTNASPTDDPKWSRTVRAVGEAAFGISHRRAKN